ncbi:MAG: alpha-galactosidase [Chitinophagaceae bacterium]|jgi:alpha-galactosidase|nr:alpha-galactosidase [Chitinophagaceae bacterium]
MKKAIIVCLFAFGYSSVFSQTVETAASIKVKQDSVFIFYNKQKICEAVVNKNGGIYHINTKKEIVGGKEYQTLVIDADKRAELSGYIFGSDESIACESDPKDGLKYVRQVIGQSHSLRNQAVYERKNDWLISFDDVYNAVSIHPATLANNSVRYQFSVAGTEIIVRLKPDYFKNHRGLHYFEPATYNIKKESINGWCSWFAYFNEIDEEKIKHAADVLSQKLKPFGLKYLQIDDGYQQTPIGLPDTWLKPNDKFPSGLQSLADYISQQGLTPGIWTNVSFADSAAAFNNKNLFVKNKQNEPAKGNWIGYIMDASQQATLNQLVSPVYSGLRRQGWKYFKLDALRHLKYEGYNSYAEYFSNKKVNRDDAFRNFVKTVRKEIGNENYLLACWGIRPELVGLADGCRIGTDGYGYAGLAQFNSYNNIIWRNDPDHIELSDKEAYRSCTATSLTGSIFMLTDKPEKYESSLIEAAKRSIPVLYTQPGQMYDIDPSRSARIEMADVEMSGSGPRVFDASSTTTTGLFLLEINKPFENWMVLGRLDERDPVIGFKDLGLNDQKTYLCFEFWTKKFLGEFQHRFAPGSIDANYHCQVFCIREKQNHPQLLATNRHISCGAFELKNVSWKNNILEGESDMTNGDDYILYIHEPENFNMKKFSCNNGQVVSNNKEGNVRTITIRSSAPSVLWRLEY